MFEAFSISFEIFMMFGWVAFSELIIIWEDLIVSYVCVCEYLGLRNLFYTLRYFVIMV